MVPCNWDPTLIKLLEGLPVRYLYGSIDGDSTLRPTRALPKSNPLAAADMIRRVKEAGIKFAYVMNATCLGGVELRDNGRTWLLQRLEMIKSFLRCDAIITSNPLVMKIVKELFPELEIQVSVLSFVDNVRKAVYFEKIGADVIHIDPSINRDFKTLKAIRKAVGCELSLLVNEGCLLDCPIRFYHGNLVSHMGGSDMGSASIDYCLFECSAIRHEDISELIKAPWIRPQDLHVYEDLGFGLFKIAGREKVGDGSSHTEWIIKAARSYYEGWCEDLAELLVATRAAHLSGSAVGVKTRIMAESLNGFLDFFIRGHCDKDCTRCNYCDEWAKKVVIVEGDKDAYVDKTRSVISSLVRGAFRTD